MAIGCSPTEVEAHLLQHDFKKFMCPYCHIGFNDINEIKEHMSLEHSTNFLFVATRQSTIKYIYLGDTCDYTKFKFFICTNAEALNCMQPNLGAKDHKIQRDYWHADQVKSPYIRPLPQIRFKNTKKEFFGWYKDYIERTSADPPITYKCITDKAASEIGRIENSMCTNLSCDCSATVPIKDKTGLKPYFDHLNEHFCFESDIEKDAISHRMLKHPKSPIVYLQVETHFEQTTVKLMRCTFRCKIDTCNTEFDMVSTLKKHHLQMHPDEVLIMEVKQRTLLVYSNDPSQTIAECRIENNRFTFGQWFSCDGKAFVGNRAEALLHHPSPCSAKNFKLHSNLTLLHNNDHDEMLRNLAAENQSQYRMYLFECMNCSELFESIEAVLKHHQNTISHRISSVKFVAKKLVGCAHCTAVSTLDGIKHHCSLKHQGQSWAPANIYNNNKFYCGFCNYIFATACILMNHFRHFHHYAETYTNALFERLDLNQTRLNDCLFEAACCPDQTFDQLRDFIRHAAKCGRIFKCSECKFEAVKMDRIVSHYRTAHGTRSDQIIKELQDIKEFLNSASLLGMRIHFPCGLIVTRRSIKDTHFEITKLKQALLEHIKNVWSAESPQIHRGLCQSQAEQ